MELAEMTINQAMEDNVKKYHDQIAMDYQEKQWTWAEMDEQTDDLAIHFLHQGIRKGTHVGIFSSNSPNWVFTYIALAKIGAVSVLINFNLKEKELISLLNYANVEYLCHGDRHKDNDMIQITRNLKNKRLWHMRQYIYIGPDKEGHWFKKEDFWNIREEDYKLLAQMKEQVKTEDFLSMMFTSGTTSIPKGVLLTQYQMLGIAKIAASEMHWNHTDRICLTLSLFHCFGLSTGLLASLVTGFTISLIGSFHSKQVLEVIEKKRCTILNGVPTMFLSMAKNEKFSQYDISSLCSGIIAGAGIRKKDYRYIVDCFQMDRLQQSYGQTEASPSITFSGYDDSIEIKEVSVGKVIPNVMLRINDEKKGIIKEPGVPGEIEIKGFNVMKRGYYRRKRETDKVITFDGWLRTGDLGYLDKDGNLYITGRKRDIIIRCGENIAPAEIEEVILQYPGILDVKVMGIPDLVSQEEIAAGIECQSGLNKEQLISYLKKNLADYKIPKYLFHFHDFPLLSNGKVDIKTLKEQILNKIKEEKE